MENPRRHSSQDLTYEHYPNKPFQKSTPLFQYHKVNKTDLFLCVFSLNILNMNLLYINIFRASPKKMF